MCVAYSELVNKYPIVDLIMNFAPVVVAILAIIINNWRSSVRDKRNKQIDIIINYESMLIDKISNVEYRLDKLLDAFSLAMKCRDDRKIRALLKDYDSAKNEVLKCSIELYNFSFQASDILKNNVNGQDITDDIKEVLELINKMFENHFADGQINELTEYEETKEKEIKNKIFSTKAWMTVKIQSIINETYTMLK